MAVALFFETEPIPAGSPQYLVFPADGSAVVLSRISDGGRKGHNVWRAGVMPAATTVLTREPSALVVSEVDEQQYAARGVPGGLATKAQAAHAKAPLTDMTVADLGNVVEDVALSHSTLDQWNRDGRRRAPITQTAAPVSQTPFVQVNVPSTPEPEPVVIDAPVTPAATDSDSTVVQESRKVCFVPAPEVAKKYVHRDIRGVQDFDTFDRLLSRNHNVALYGPTGSAKTTVALAYAAHKGLKVAMVSGSVTLEPSQIFGAYAQDGKGGWYWQDGIVTEVVRDGGIIILDEINFIPGKIATVLFPLLQSGTRHLTLLDHGGETIKAHPDLHIFSTWNPRYAGTMDLNAALRNRFAVQIEWGYDDAVEKRLIKSKAVREIGTKMRAQVAADVLYTPIPTNALVEFCEFAELLGVDWAVGNFIDRFEDDEKSVVKTVFDPILDALREDFGEAVVTPEPEVVESDVTADDALRTVADLNL